MKNTLLLLLVAAIFFPACKKSSSTTATPVTPYSVTGIHDVRIHRYSSTTATTAIQVPLTLEYLGSDELPVTVGISSQATGVFYCTYDAISNATFSGPWTGVPTFTIPGVMFCNNTAMPGTYTFTVTCTRSDGSVKTFTFNATIE